MSAIAWGFLLRLGQVCLEAALTLAVGLFVAGTLRRMVGPAGTRHLFGRGFKGLLRGWLAGMLLPVCSLGVIPVAREMRRVGVPDGIVLSFALAAPLLNPISFLYGLTLAEPVVILTFAGLSLAVCTAAGWLWDRFFAGAGAAEATLRRAEAADAELLPSAGPRRLLAVIATAGSELLGRDLRFYTAGVVVSAALAAAIPFGALQNTMKHTDATSPLLMAAVATPIFSSPLPGMMRIGLMFDHGNSIGAAFVLFLLGVGLSAGSILWLISDFGRRAALWLLAVFGLVLVVAYGCDRALHDSRKAEIEHTHAFDDYSNPFPSDALAGSALVVAKLGEKFGPLEQTAAGFLAGLALVGVAYRRGNRTGAIEAWLVRPTEIRPRGRWDVELPRPLLGGVAILGLFAFAIAGAFVYYPDRAYCLDRMAAINAEAAIALRTGHAEQAERHLEEWDLLARKLEVGTLLRSHAITGEQSRSLEELREALEVVRDRLRDGAPDEARKSFDSHVQEHYRAVKVSYRD